MISWGFVIPAVQNNIPQYIAFFRAYLDTIYKALGASTDVFYTAVIIGADDYG